MLVDWTPKEGGTCWICEPEYVQSGSISGGSTTGTGSGSMTWGTDRMGSDYSNFDLRAADPGICQQACSNDSRCRAWTYVHPNITQGPNPRCWLKHSVPKPKKSSCCVSGVK